MSERLPTIVIPIYNALAALKSCLKAVSETIPADVDVLLLDDASTDAGVVPLLQEYSDRFANWRWQSCRKNRGFVMTANVGMEATRNDVVLLNSDTIPAAGWYESLAEAAASFPDAATITPWSNNGEIVSIPEFCKPNPVPENLAALGLVLRERVTPAAVELPTAVGFCMLITRRAIDSVGHFDAEQFGQGYGEENDYSLRARAEGLRNYLCTNAYVAHIGNQSFGPKGLSPGEESMTRLLHKHPEYLNEIGAYIEEDPIGPFRTTVLGALMDAGIQLPATMVSRNE